MSRDAPLGAKSLDSMIDRDYVRSAPLVLPTLVDDSSFVSAGDIDEVGCDALIVASRSDPLHPVKVAAELNRILPSSVLQITPPRYLRPILHSQAVRQQISVFLGERARRSNPEEPPKPSTATSQCVDERPSREQEIQ